MIEKYITEFKNSKV